eukprot:s2293_g4.t1
MTQAAPGLVAPVGGSVASGGPQDVAFGIWKLWANEKVVLWIRETMVTCVVLVLVARIFPEVQVRVLDVVKGFLHVQVEMHVKDVKVKAVKVAKVFWGTFSTGQCGGPPGQSQGQDKGDVEAAWANDRRCDTTKSEVSGRVEVDG